MSGLVFAASFWAKRGPGGINVTIRLRTLRSAAFSIAPLLLMTGCGSGDGGTSAGSANPIPANTAPIFGSAASVSVVENTAASFYQATSTDAQNDPITYSIAGGADAARFTITSSGHLNFVSPPNYDLPNDADENNVYLVRILASDGKASTALDLAITVNNSKEGIAVKRVATGFTDPVAISAVSDNAVLVAEKTGAIYTFNPQTGTKTLLTRVTNVGTVGIVAIAATPTYATDHNFFVLFQSANGFLYLNHYVPAGFAGDFNASLVLFANAPDYAGGGWLAYDAAGTLYVGTGDSGGTASSAQDSASNLGKIIKVTPNPDPYAGAAPQFFLTSRVGLGLHRPNGSSVINGNIFFADRGQTVAEEIDGFSPPSSNLNHGWPFKEGDTTVQGIPPVDLVAPLLAYPHGTGRRAGAAIVGGARGPNAITTLRDQYVFADQNGAIFSVDISATALGAAAALARTERRDADFAPDQGTIDHPVAIGGSASGQLYIVDTDGEIFRIDAG